MAVEREDGGFGTYKDHLIFAVGTIFVGVLAWLITEQITMPVSVTYSEVMSMMRDYSPYLQDKSYIVSRFENLERDADKAHAVQVRLVDELVALRLEVQKLTAIFTEQAKDIERQAEDIAKKKKDDERWAPEE